MNKFKVGDKVRYTIDGRFGATVTVTKVDGDKVYAKSQSNRVAYCNNCDSVEYAYTREDLEEAMNVFEALSIFRYSGDGRGGYTKYAHKGYNTMNKFRILNRIFPTKQQTELAKLEEQAQELADNIKQLKESMDNE